jgi:F0F1-type ATP synthase epsilon subunit
MAMDMGAVKILDENNQTIEEYLIAGGSADIKENTCEILTESAFNKEELTLEQVREMNDEFPNPFYRWLVKEFEKNTNIK